MTPINKELIDTLVRDRAVRQKVVYESHLMFFLVYFSHYVKYELANFHEEIFRITQDSENKLACIVAFRGSGKSTLITTSYTLWSILGRENKKFVLVICQTKAQAKQHMMNLRSELENNKLLQSDLGPFQEESDLEWASSSLVFSNTNSRITIASIDQSIRGIRHLEHRPELIILDDIEDVQSVKTLDSRDKTFDWFTREIIPLGDLNTRVIIVGNLLHQDSLVSRIKKKIEKNEVKGIYKEYPLIDMNGVCLWPGKFPIMESLEDFKKTIISPTSWQREYLLLNVADEDQVIKPEWIQYYDELPKNRGSYSHIIMAVDPAISDSEKADFTGIVFGLVTSVGLSHYQLHILPNPINERMDFPSLIQRIKNLNEELKKTVYGTVKVVVESVGYQEAITQQLVREGLNGCKGVKTTINKRSRLSIISHRIKNGDIRFPKVGAEKLINQIVNFGNEPHDDLMDAFTICAQKYSEIKVPSILFI
jgi:phage terminase large subunit-like protein